MTLNKAVMINEPNKIRRFALITNLSALAMEVTGMKFKDRRSVIIKKLLGLPKKHPLSMTLMYANAWFYVHGWIHKSLYDQHISILQRYGK